MANRLSGQVAIITGAGRGLGRAYALAFAANGAKVLVNDAGIQLSGDGAEASSPAEAVVSEIRATGAEAIADYSDVRIETQVEQMVQKALNAWGKIDIIVCNAGNLRHLKFSETTEDDLRSHLDIHVVGTFLSVKAVWPHMAARKYGRIVMTTSQVGLFGQADAVAYGAAKMGIIGLMHGIKLEAPQHNILVNCISPFAATRMASGTFPDDIARFIDPAWVAPAVVVLASKACTLQGEVIIAGGGHVGLARAIETQGIDVDAPWSLTPDQIEEALGRICDTTNAREPTDALSAVRPTFDRVATLSTHHFR